MTDGMFCAKCLSQYQEILSKTRLFGTGKYSKLGRTLYKSFFDIKMARKLNYCGLTLFGADNEDTKNFDSQ